MIWTQSYNLGITYKYLSLEIQKFAQKGLIFNQEKTAILTGRYHKSKYLADKLNGKLFLPGGQVNFAEQPDTSFIREVREETGITIIPLQPLYVWTWIYQKGKDKKQIFGLARLGIYCRGKLNVKAKSESELEISCPFWLPIDEIKLEEFVFDEQPVIKNILAYRELL